MNEDKAYISYGNGVLTIACIFKGSIILKGDMFNALVNHLLRTLNLGNTSDSFKERFKKAARINNFTNRSVEVAVNDPKKKIAKFVISSR